MKKTKQGGRRIMKLCKKLVLCLLAVAVVLLCFAAFPQTANAADASTYKYEYDLEKGGYYITYIYGENPTGKVELPGSYNGQPVIGIKHGLFAYEQKVTSVTIPYGVKDIGDNAFYFCTELRTVTIPSTVTRIGYGAFEMCDNLKFNIYDNAMYLGNSYNPYYALIGPTSKDITSCTIHPNTEVIADRAFYPCKNLTSVTLPYSLKAIGTWAFQECTALTSVTIPNGVTILGDRAFYGCTALTSVRLGSGVKTFGEEVFSGCTSISDVTIAKGATIIGAKAFSGCASLINLTIPDTVTTIDYYAFAGCDSLASVTIPNSVKTIEESAFAGCNSLTTVTIGTGVRNMKAGAFSSESIKEVHIQDLDAWIKISFEDEYANPLHSGASLYLKGNLATNLVIPNSITAISDYAFIGCSSLISINTGNNVTTIGQQAFENCTNLASVIQGDKVTGIGQYAFKGCTSLTDITLSSSLATIKEGAFKGCAGLTSITIPSSVTTVEEEAFYGCTGLKEVHIQDMISWLEIDFAIRQANPLYYAEVLYLNGEPITELVIPNGITSIGTSAFMGYKALTSVTIPDSVTTIGDYAFQGCSGLTSIIIPNSVTKIDYAAFNQCSSLTSVTISDSVTNMGPMAFSSCPVEQLSILEGTKEITSKMIVGANTLQEIVIPASLTTIDPQVLSACINLSSFQVDERNPAYYSAGGCLIETDSKTVVVGCATSQIPADGSVTAIGDYAFVGRANMTGITIPDCITAIGNYAFKACTGLTEITIPSSVATIGDYAFSGCAGLTAFAIPDSVTTVGEYLLDGCTGLTSVSLGNGVTSISAYMFKGCAGLTSIIIPDSVTSVGGGAFYGCAGLTEIIIPDGVTSIGGSAFYDCTNLASVTIPDGVTSIGWYTFYQCKNLTSITLPSKLTSIGKYAFESAGLTSIIIPEGVTTIGESAFLQCKSLTSINIPDGVTAIADRTFAVCYSLTSIAIPDGVTTIGNHAFYMCSRMRSVTLPSSVAQIEFQAFYNCTDLATVIYCGTQQQWEDISIDSQNSYLTNATRQYHNYENGVCTICQYYDATSVLSFTLNSAGDGYIVSDCQTFASGNLEIVEHYNGKPVVGIGENAFADCANLTGITIGQNITAIGKDAFAGCTSLAEVFYKGTQEQWAAMAIDGENQVLRSALFHHSCADAKNHWQVKDVEPTCTEAGYQYETCSCGHERNKVAGDAATGHSWVEANCAAPKTCFVCQATEGSANTDTHILGQWEIVKTATPVASGERKRTCPCGGSFETEEIPYVGNGVVLTGELAEETVVYIDGLPYEVKADGDGRYVELPKAGELLLVTYTYNEGDGQDVHTQYPTGMKVYLVKDGQITHIPELDNLLQYSGSSIRISGKKGIRMITSIEKDKKTALTGKGLAGYTLVEYGTTLCFANEIPEGDGLVLGRSYARSNYAYKKNVADPVFATSGNLVQYTNVLVGFSLDQCKDDIAMRPYIILKNAQGKEFTLYGGTIYRSIGYIAYQNRTVFQPKTASYNYVWEIIHHVYGDKYDADYKG